MTELRTENGRFVLIGDSVQIERPDGRMTIPIAEIEELAVLARIVHLRRIGHPVASADDMPGDLTVLPLTSASTDAALEFRAALRAAQQVPDEAHITLSRPAVRRESFGPASRDRPDIKAAMHWFRQLSELPTTDRWLIESVGDDELVLMAEDTYRDNAEGWNSILVTDRRLLYATALPEPRIYELPLSVLIRIEQGETNGSGHVQAQLIDRTGRYNLWFKSLAIYHHFRRITNEARSFSIYAKPPAPEPSRGASTMKQFEEYTALRNQIEAGTVPEHEIGSRIGAIFGVTPG